MKVIRIRRAAAAAAAAARRTMTRFKHLVIHFQVRLTRVFIHEFNYLGVILSSNTHAAVNPRERTLTVAMVAVRFVKMWRIGTYITLELICDFARVELNNSEVITTTTTRTRFGRTLS